MQRSQRIVNRFSASGSLKAFLNRHAENIDAKLEKRLQVVLLPGESMPDFAFAMRLFARYLMHLRDRPLASSTAARGLGEAVLVKQSRT